MHKIALIDKQTNRNHFIDVLKGVCIIFVIITHFSWTDEERLRYLFPFWIDMAVPIFMIISGYVYSYSYKKNNIRSIRDAYLLKNIMSKMVRYTVPFVIAFTIEVAYLFVAGTSEGIVTIGMRFLQGGYGLGSYYYPVMMQFIFVFPIIYFIVGKYGHQGVIICGIMNAVYELLQRAYMMNEPCYRLLVFRYILVISVGCWMANDSFAIKRRNCIVSFAIGIAFIVANCYLGYSPKVIIYWTRTSFLACLYIIPLAMLIINRGKNLRFKPLEMLGKASYNVFLVQMVWYAFCREIVATYIEDRCVQLFLNVFVCCAVGMIFYIVETPITKRINKRIYSSQKFKKLYL